MRQPGPEAQLKFSDKRVFCGPHWEIVRETHIKTGIFLLILL